MSDVLLMTLNLIHIFAFPLQILSINYIITYMYEVKKKQLQSEFIGTSKVKLRDPGRYPIPPIQKHNY